MLDTNVASYVIKGNPPQARERLATLPMDSIVVSAVTQAELLYGCARKGHPTAFVRLVREFLLRVQVLPWGTDSAMVYGDLRASCTASGITLGALDMMIAAHAVAARAILVTHDKAFGLVPGGVLATEDWVDGA
ncbi:type II toxin-antitoxin system VapC family toxin [Verminephrobacter aporrectodeae]|uniref:type II toxin-antitoxin system VapC family toxin n=1 Tax=Verminephrobacter aporrectodeae TaxID=1110389 RepID=UPI00030DA629|nr:type II toxin-antitoxin system VapC family toxin [Verminephrobacter aporrectodeae]